MRAGRASAPSVTGRLGIAASLALAAGLPATAHAAAPAAAWDAVSGVFVGPDGLHIGPVVAGGVIAALLVITIIARLARKPAPAAAQTARVASPAARTAPVRPQPSARPEPQRPAATPAQPAKAQAPNVQAAKAAPAAPAARPATPVSTEQKSAAKATPLLRETRKLPPELDLKHRDPASRTGAVAPAVKLVFERRGVIAHVEKMKLTDELDSTKRRPTTFHRGRRTA